MKLKSYAKVNLYLRVLSRRKDGFHDIETLFERINLCDDIFLQEAPSGIQVASSCKALPTGPLNIAYRAADLLKTRYQVTEGVRIYIQKRIPIAAGLGGGSSNAASVLLGLNKLWKLRLSKYTLLKLGAELGSDVSFFVLNTTMAFGTGHGQNLRNIHYTGPKLWHVLMKPPFGISTKSAYEALPSSCLTPKKANVRMLVHSIQKGQWGTLDKLLTNSLEGTLNKRVTTILRFKKMLLKKGALHALMSGSGSTLFGIFSSQKNAKKAADQLKRKNKSWEVFVASTF